MEETERRQRIEAFFGEWIGPMGRPYTSNELFARAAGFNESAVYSWRKGEHLSNRTLRKMAGLTGANIKYLMVLNGDLEREELEEDGVLCAV